MAATKRAGGAPVFRFRLAALAVASCFAGGTHANPNGASVISGSASFSTSGNALNITNSPGAIIQWQNFSIRADELTRFIQQNAASSVLNRVVGSDISSILGQLLSNGKVFLLNPNGIFIGGGAVIDTAGFVASSLRLSDADFLAGKFKFDEQIGAGRVVNQGTINANGGPVYLVAPNVENHGVITSPTGEVILAAGKSVELVTAANPNLRVELNAPENEAINVGKIVADAGSVGIYGTTIKNSGTVRANSASVDAQGHIVFKAKKDVTLDATSVLTANGPKGGSVTVQAEGGTLLDSGVIEAKGTEGKGGTVQLLGDRVGLIDHATVTASGETGGGTVLVGGDYQGKNSEVQNASGTYVGKDVVINADALETGDGGKVIVWADDATRAYGSVSARGGSTSGDGGFVEISGKKYLRFDAAVDTRAPRGKVGTLLLDPDNIIIDNTTDENDLGETAPNPVVFTAGAADPSHITWTTIDNRLNSNDVTIQTVDGNITVADSSAPVLGSTALDGTTLWLKSGGAVNINADVISSVGTNLRFTGANGGINVAANVSVWGTGNITFDSATVLATNTALTLTGGVTFQHSGIRSLEFT